MNALLFQDLGGFDAFPGGGDLDEDAIAADAGLAIEADQLAGFGDRGFGVKAQAGIDLGGDAAGDDFEDLLAEGDADFIEGFAHHLFGGGRRAADLAGFAQGGVDQVLVGRNLGGRQDQGGVGGGVPGGELLDRIDVTGVGDHNGHRGQLVEEIGHAGHQT